MTSRASRRSERLLLLPVSLAVWSGSVFFYLAAPHQYGEAVLYAGLGLVATFYAVHLLLDRTGHRGDVYLYPVACMLSTIGLIYIYRVQPELAARQFLWVMLGLTALSVVVIKGRDMSRLEDFKYLYIVLGMAFLLVTALMGTEVGGARAWLSMGSFRFEPAEGVKLLAVLFLASYLRDSRELLSVPGRSRQVFWGPLVLVWGLSLALLVFQRDLGTAVIFFLTFLAMIYTGTSRSAYVLAGLACLTAGAVLGYYLFAHVRVRVEVWLDPWTTLNAGGYQIAQSLFAFGSGGVMGTGLGLGTPRLIPAAATDLILAVIGEETGLAGSVGTMMLYMLFAYRGYRAAANARCSMESLLAAGLTSLVAFHAIIITAGVTKLLPLTGITLPFISYGGSSMVINFILLALLINISGNQEPAGGVSIDPS
ncbi:hypothetical protein SY88_01195 [Clostridiales bacterium PH28_bin88]|nr:hypothetical protein SY88_01195 [Clostridiales bacterium PH28_bin88]